MSVVTGARRAPPPRAGDPHARDQPNFLHQLLANVAVSRATDWDYRRNSSSLSLLRWAATVAAPTFGFPEGDSSNA